LPPELDGASFVELLGGATYQARGLALGPLALDPGGLLVLARR